MHYMHLTTIKMKRCEGETIISEENQKQISVQLQWTL